MVQSLRDLDRMELEREELQLPRMKMIFFLPKIEKNKGIQISKRRTRESKAGSIWL